MKLRVIVSLCCICCVAAGCQEQHSSQETDNLDVELVRALNNIGLENAIIAQRTLYPYHFIADSERLNELGRRDLAVLARHLREHGGALNVRQGQIAEELYYARLTQVADELKQAGVGIDRADLSDGLPGGDGISSQRTVMILTQPTGGNRLAGRPGYSGRITQ